MSSAIAWQLADKAGTLRGRQESGHISTKISRATARERSPGERGGLHGHAGRVARISLSAREGYLLICLLPQAQIHVATAINWRDGQITSDFPKSCQARESKIFRFRSSPNHRHNSARLTADEGRSRSSRTRSEMRWTLMARKTYAPEAYGEVVWFGRRGAGATLAVAHRSNRIERGFADNGGKRAVLRGEHEVSRKAIAQGRPECFPLPCMLVCSFC